MFNVKTWLTGAGIALTIAGGVMAWKFSPPNPSGIIDDAENESNDRRVERLNRLMHIGAFLLLGGALLQLVANFL